jgi:type 1 glutamine amidotransferase/HEAT repeat protein
MFNPVQIGITIPSYLRVQTMKQCTLFLLMTLAATFIVVAAPLPDDVCDAVKQVRTSDGVQPRQPFYLLEQFVPRAAGNEGQRQQLAHILAEAVMAPGTTPAARTVLCQHLAKVAGEAERERLHKMLADPATAPDARIALGEAAVARAKAEPESVYLAEAVAAKPSARVAGLSALAHHYLGKAVPACMKALNDSDPVVSATAVRLLGRFDGSSLAQELLRLDPERQVLALEVLAERKVLVAREAVTKLLASSDAAVRQAAAQALGAVGDASSVGVLAEMGADEALAQLTAPGADAAVLKGIGTGKAAARIALMTAAVARGVPELTPALLQAAVDQDEAVQTAALKLLGRCGDVSAYPQIVAMLGGTASAEAENAVKGLGRRMTDRPSRLTPLLTRLRGSQVPAATQVAVLRTLAPLGGEDALMPVRERLTSADGAVRDAAVRALAEWPDPVAVADLRAIADDPAASTVHRTLAKRSLERLAASWRRYAALAYLDCGPAAEVAGKEGVRLRVVTGKPWTYSDQPEGTVAFDSREVVVEAVGLKAGRAYQFGFTWWDHDGNGRVQSVWVNEQQVMEKTTLPTYKGKQEPPATLTVTVPAAAVRDGRVSLRFRREAASNAVLSEIWLTDEPAQENRPATMLPAVETPVAPAVKANAGAAKKVLVVTGLEYPGHPWRLTAPALVNILAQDKRLEVSLTEEPRNLALPLLNAYDVIVLNYQNDKIPAPEGALENLKRAVEGGKGLILFHFACGAFIDWPTKTVAPDFGVIAGRVWNPKLRGHDPRGPFRVRIADVKHPITQGLADFDTEDELYTCLDGTASIQVLATARSNVDQKEYPIAFVLTPGKGRTFHCVLGHDLKALNEAVGSLYRRGAAWAAGLE